MQIVVDHTEYSILVQTTKKQIPSLQISQEGLITVLVPKSFTADEINAFLLKNSTKLQKAKQRVNERIVISTIKSYEEEEHYLYLGKPRTLDELLKTIPAPFEEKQQALKQFYTMKTKEIIEKKIAYYEPIIGVKSKGFTIIDSPKTWGTCNSSRALTFYYKLSMAHPDAINYVVIHELCHILHMNHDRSFWRKVGTYDKDFKKHQSYLAYYGPFMTI